MFSIDQNCHSLWDVVPKLHALARRGQGVTHFIEDIDAAFTALGADVDSGQLEWVRERFHRSGGADWGAAMFYTEFLGRQPTEIRDWEPATGLKTNVLAKKLDRDLDDLYDEFSPGDNWQLIGPSFVGDREHHRVIGDLSVAETAPFVRRMLDTARRDMTRSFPAADSQQRLSEWFDRETALVARLLDQHSAGRLVDLYRAWMSEHVTEPIRLDLTSRLFACDTPQAPGLRLLGPFLTDYDRAAACYNDAVAATDMRLRPLDTRAGELPVFATIAHQGRLVRSAVRWQDRQVHVDGRSFRPDAAGRLDVAALSAAGVQCLAGKAMLLVCQVRMGEAGTPLAVPYRGSLYLPAAHAFARNLAAAGLLAEPLAPIVRVRLRLLDRLREIDTPIRLPAYLADAMGREEVPARELGEAWRDLADAARLRLESFRAEPARERWQAERFPDETAEIARLDARRRILAPKDPKAPELREIWKRVRDLQTRLLDASVRRIDHDTQLAELEYYDTRGAALPWCLALGGESFYNELIARAEIYDEPSLH